MGTLFVVATPIGNLSDLSDRAREVLRRSLSQHQLCGLLCDGLERAMGL